MLTQVANIIFLDQPVGTGFSYANSWESYKMNDSVSATESCEFLSKWLKLHPEFLSNPLHIAGDSYSGVIVPMVTLQVSKGNEAGLKPKMNLQGYLLGNPMTNPNSDVNSRVAFAHLKALISDELYESAIINCNGDYVNVDESNADCVDDLKVVTKCLRNIYTANILETHMCVYDSEIDGACCMGPQLNKRRPFDSPSSPGGISPGLVPDEARRCERRRIDAWKQPPGHGLGEVLHQRSSIPYSFTSMAIASLFRTRAIGYFMLYQKFLPQINENNVL
ncbi:hypothetical protein NL676_038989 [Syzygium grande]|nr:hypothetical protein NL676_038989 [Syzygium grande]